MMSKYAVFSTQIMKIAGCSSPDAIR